MHAGSNGPVDPFGRAEPPTRFQVPLAFNHFQPTSVLEIDEEWEPGESSRQSGAPQRLVLACFLLGFDLDTTGVVVQFDVPRSIVRGFSHTPFPVGFRNFNRGSKILSEVRFREIVELADMIPEFRQTERTREDIVFHRLLQGLGDEDGFLDIVISLESALLQGMKDELRYRFALYGALLLADVLPTEKTFDRLKNVYDVRSSLVHGSPPPKKKAMSERHSRNNAAARRDAKELGTAIALKIVRSGWPDHDSLNMDALGTRAAAVMCDVRVGRTGLS